MDKSCSSRFSFLCVLSVLCGVSLFLSACDRQAAPGGSAANSAVKLQLNWLPEPQFGGFYAAKSSNYAREHELTIDVVKGGPGTPTVQMVAAGTVPFGVASADEVIISRTNGSEVIALYAVYQTNPQGIMVHAARKYTKIDDIFKNDGTLAMQKGLPYALFLEKKFGFDKLKIVPSPGGDLSAFRTDANYSMQCFVTSEPLTAKKAGLDAQAFLIADAGYNPYTTVLVTTEKYLKLHRDVVDQVVAAVSEGWQTYLNDPAATNAEMRKLNPTMDEQTFADSAEAQKPLIMPAGMSQNDVGTMTRQRWQTLINQLFDLNVIINMPSATDCFVAPAPAASRPRPTGAATQP